MNLFAARFVNRVLTRCEQNFYLPRREPSSVSQASACLLARARHTYCRSVNIRKDKEIGQLVSPKCCWCVSGRVLIFKRSKGSQCNEQKDKSTKEETDIDERIYTHHHVDPPNPDSNLRRITFAVPKKLNSYDKKLIQERDKTFEWNDEFWRSHNKKFFQEKKEFSKKIAESDKFSESESSDEMSKFYKDFLDRHYQMHMDYNRQWYKRNFGMLITALCASLKRLLPGR